MKIIVLIAMLLLPFAAAAQPKALTFEDAAAQGLTVEKLDKQYTSALDTDTAKAAFTGKRQQDFFKAYTAMLTELALYLKDNGFAWGQPTRLVHRIYFKPDGKIDYYLVNLKALENDEVKKEKFVALLNTFIQYHKINITADKKFAQCGPAIYQDKK
ncbi:hypothetical protein LJ707_17445 [Mucilaginibacter sp. UR6-1]|uniref:hypothetical protein n=1 Tax=Mucilaginibacter sp. UR6-1 TaxID=1435643 RepID=UPI001E58D8E2|nr:hypothetical protein [Mucilaginibacter sp. UR6-1]MCC8410731.1 hypothetical protein [Mucilaginibacter sp. UR6-1]